MSRKVKQSQPFDPNILHRWLFLADSHYLSARLLYLHGLYTDASIAAFYALETIMKAWWYSNGGVKANIVRVSDRHDLTVIAKHARLTNLILRYENTLSYLTSAFQLRYADNWDQAEDIKWTNELQNLDGIYNEVRNHIVQAVIAIGAKMQSLPIEVALRGNTPFASNIEVFGSWSWTKVLATDNIYWRTFLKIPG